MNLVQLKWKPVTINCTTLCSNPGQQFQGEIPKLNSLSSPRSESSLVHSLSWLMAPGFMSLPSLKPRIHFAACPPLFTLQDSAHASPSLQVLSLPDWTLPPSARCPSYLWYPKTYYVHVSLLYSDWASLEVRDCVPHTFTSPVRSKWLSHCCILLVLRIIEKNEWKPEYWGKYVPFFNFSPF